MTISTGGCEKMKCAIVIAWHLNGTLFPYYNVLHSDTRPRHFLTKESDIVWRIISWVLLVRVPKKMHGSFNPESRHFSKCSFIKQGVWLKNWGHVDKIIFNFWNKSSGIWNFSKIGSNLRWKLHYFFWIALAHFSLAVKVLFLNFWGGPIFHFENKSK